MEGFADLLTDAFSETSVPPFPDEDLDFENLAFEEKSDEDGTENVTTNNKEATLLQEATGEAAALFETKEAAENVYEEHLDNETDEEDFKGEGIGALDGDKTPEEDYMSSDGDSALEGSVSGEDDEGVEEDIGVAETPGDLLMSVRCSDEFNDSNKEDEIFAEGQPMAPEDAENSQVRNEELGEAESDEDVSYFVRLPDRGDETVIKAAEIGEDEGESEEEEEEEDISSDPECEGMKIEQEENVIGQPLEEEEEVENIYGDNLEDASSEFPCVSLQNVQELSGEGDNGEYAEKIIDFSGDEHQEAGESFADYPSDFSSCEYADDGRKIQESRPNFWPGASECSSYTQQDAFMEGPVEDITQMDRAEDSDAKEGGYLYSRDLEMDAENLMSMDVAAGEQDRGSTATTKSDDEEDTSESDYSSSDDDEARRCLQELENNKQLADSQIYGASRADRADFLSWDFDVLNTDSLLTEYLLTTGDMTETTPAGVNQDHPEYISYSEVQSEILKIKSPSYQGSLDDSFFFNDAVEASGIPQQGKLEGEDYEEERNWEQEEKRIKAFNDFYGDEENEREGRQIKVQFCAEPLSQVIRYESDSDEDSLSTSTDGGREDMSSTESSDELREPDNTLQMKPACDPPKAQLAESEPDLSNTQTCREKYKGASIMKLILKMGLLTGMGLLMFWLATDQGEWLNQVFFF